MEDEASAKAMADYRTAMLSLLTKSGDRRDRNEEEVAEHAPRWAASAPDTEVNRWLTALRPRPYRARAAARIALGRALEGNLTSARSFLELAHAALGEETPEALVSRLEAEKVDWEASKDLEALIPAWWRLGHVAWATRGLAAYEAKWPFVPKGTSVRDDGSLCSESRAYDCLRIAALAGQSALVVPRLVPQTSNARERMIKEVGPGLTALYEGGDVQAFHAAMTTLSVPIQDRERVNTAPAWDEALSFALVTYLIRRGRPGEYVELYVRYPYILSSLFVVPALREVEQRSPKEAVRLSAWLLEGKHLVDTRWRTRLEPVALLAKHAPTKANAWAEGPEGKNLIDNECDGHPLLGQWRGTRLAVLAALGYDERLQRVYAGARAKQTGEVEKSDRVAIAAMTADHGLAREMLLAIDAEPTHNREYDRMEEHDVESLAMLDAVGERAYVDGWLEKELVAANPRPGHKFSLGLAPELGRGDLGFVALKYLGARGTPRILAQSERYLDGITAAGDWERALSVLEALKEEARFPRMLRAFEPQREMRRFEARYSPVRSTVGPGRP